MRAVCLGLMGVLLATGTFAAREEDEEMFREVRSHEQGEEMLNTTGRAEPKPCACEDRGTLRPAQDMEWSKAPQSDPQCEGTDVHAPYGISSAKACSCKEGMLDHKASNFKELSGEVEAGLREAFDPIMKDINNMVSEYQAKLSQKAGEMTAKYGIKLTMPKLSVKIPKWTNQGFDVQTTANQGGKWRCCCLSGKAGSCKKNVVVDSRLVFNNYHHEAPESAC